MKLPTPLWLTAFWIALCAYLNCAGWILSSAHQLNPSGYAVSLALGLALLILQARVTGRVPVCSMRWRKLRWRAGRPLPAIFFLVALLVLIGGMLYPPNNFDALTYRFPRILHWLAEGRWHWIDAPERRVNLSAVGFEWLMAPLFALTRSDRGFFLINLLPYLLLPGLIFSTFVRLGISKRVAWVWMWLLPCGYCFVLQAGSIANDSFAAIYLLAALCFGLRARQTGRLSDVCISILAAALLTGAKASNLPLLLPCLVVLLPSLGLIWRKRWAVLAVVPVAVICSFLPIAAVNAYYTGDWTGDPGNGSQMQLENPFYGLIGNAVQLIVNNVQPPVMPFANAWNNFAPKFVEKHCHQLAVHFPQMGLRWGELPIEELSGIGLGITALGVISFLGGLLGCLRREPSRFPGRPLPGWGYLICGCGLIALGVLMAKFGNEGAGRIIAPYYPIIVASLLLPRANRALIGKRWWKLAALITALMALPCVILTPSRPLFPAKSLFNKLAASHPQNRVLARARQVYEVYANRADSLGTLRKHVPEDAKVIGFIGVDESEVALWRPFGARQVVDLSRSSKPKIIPSTVITAELSMQFRFGMSVEEWIKFHKAKIIGHENFTTKINRGSQDWYVIGLPAR